MIDLKSAKYKNVEFLFEEMTTSGGNRLVKFNYPGSDKQSIERQGKVPKVFSMVIWIANNNYYQERDAILRVLDDGEKGTLVHPTFGDVENIINGAYELTETISELGHAKIDVTFEVDDSTGIPTQSSSLPSQVKEQSDLLNFQLDSDLKHGYNVSLSNTGNFSDASDNLFSVTKFFSEAIDTVNAAAEEVAIITNEIDAFASQIGALITSPAHLSESLSSLFESLDNLFETPAETLGAFSLLFDFGNDDPVITPDTSGRTERKRNREIVKASVKAQSISYAYVNAALQDYDTTGELETVQSRLEAQYVDLRDNQLLSNESLELLDRVRVQAQKTFDNASVSTNSIITINTCLKPLSVLLYEYYGHTDFFDVIAELNNIKQNAFVEGDIRILTA